MSCDGVGETALRHATAAAAAAAKSGGLEGGTAPLARPPCVQHGVGWLPATNRTGATPRGPTRKVVGRSTLTGPSDMPYRSRLRMLRSARPRKDAL